ncbi:MAG: uridine kinase [Candidatus Pelagibacter sp. TMED64]|nr:uridine kinase [Candidatus Pelagibacter sp.]OUU67894.1 MAG: uridine kinase [Candidatus Pelagibacter sp. TMED64]|tara:strand:+ start:14421 stop:15341 length:921 start_codon:yes stop_codon:yes gene_type:complete
MQLVDKCFSKVKDDCLNYISSQETESEKFRNKNKLIKSFLIPQCIWIAKKANKKKTLIIGVAGGQGTGKTTISTIITLILKKYFKFNVLNISIDDFYKSRKKRSILSKRIHPLLKTRGVPGTHDIEMINLFFKSLKRQKFKKTNLPKFQKSIDDRLPKSKWQNINIKPEVIIFEGWCVGAKPQSSYLLKEPINSLEKNEDKNLIWRKYFNDMLKKKYKNTFSMIDHIIFMKAPSFRMVLKWRMIQEKKLKNKSNYKKKIMSNSQVKRFVMFYQRITTQMIKDLTKSASIVMLLNNHHEIKKIFFKK